jgi:hypothetical protein
MLAEFLMSESGLAVIGAAGGFMFRHIAENRKNNRDFQLASLSALSGAQDAAAARGGVGGTAMRRMIYGLVAFMFVSVVVAGFTGVPVVVEVVTQKGALFWKHSVTEFVSVDGVLFPPEVRKGFLALLGFYLGQGVK